MRVKRWGIWGALVALIMSAASFAYPDYGDVAAAYRYKYPNWAPNAAGIFVFEYDVSNSTGVGKKIRTRWDTTDPQDHYAAIDLFCIEPDVQVPGIGEVKVFDVTSLEYATVQGTSEATLTTTQVATIEKLWQQARDTYSVAELAVDTLTGIQAAIIQYALWEIVTTPDDQFLSEGYVVGLNDDVPAGSSVPGWYLTYGGTDTRDETNQLLSAAVARSDGEDKLGALIDPVTQDFIGLFEIPVPEPTTAGLMLLGLLGLAVRRRR